MSQPGYALPPMPLYKSWAGTPLGQEAQKARGEVGVGMKAGKGGASGSPQSASLTNTNESGTLLG